MTVTATGEWKADTREVLAGALFVPATQQRLLLLTHLFEPASPDSLLSWGFFNAHLEQKEYLEAYVTEAYARELLEDPAVRAEFDSKLKDEAFAKDPDARLRFFALRHPSFDERMNLYPVFRTDERW